MIERMILNSLRSNGGASVNLAGNSPDHGFMVSREGSERVFDGYPNETDIHEYLASVDPRGAYIGTWFNPENGKTYLDVSENVQRATHARRLGKARKQISIYKVSTGDVIVL